MTREWIVRPRAQAGIEDAVTWSEQQQFGLGSRFLDGLDHILKRIRLNLHDLRHKVGSRKLEGG